VADALKHKSYAGVAAAEGVPGMAASERVS
jgi:hypothetical protein